jgi:hypothetical protein
MTRTRSAVLAFAAGFTAVAALAQNADMDTAGPTRNDYLLRVVEPAQGSEVTGTSVRVVVDTSVRQQLGGERVDTNTMPRPMVDVFLDGAWRAKMKDAENVLELDHVSPGPHKLTFVAVDRANEIIDRKVVDFTATAPSVAAVSSPSLPAPTRAAKTAAKPPLPTEPSIAPQIAENRAQPSVPATASNDPAWILAGGGLLLGAWLIRRTA